MVTVPRPSKNDMVKIVRAIACAMFVFAVVTNYVHPQAASTMSRAALAIFVGSFLLPTDSDKKEK